MKNNKKYYLKHIINYFFKNKKINIFDACSHKGQFLKKVGYYKIKQAILVDPLDYKINKKKELRKFKFIKCLLGEKVCLKKFYFHSKLNPEWSSVNKIDKESPYHRLYFSRLNKKVISKKFRQNTIDSIIKKNPINIDLIKIDCQSQTLEILKGAKKTLKSKNIKMIVCALNITNFYKNKNDDLVKISSFLKKFKYNFYSVLNAHSGEIGKIDFDFKNFKIWTFDAIFLKNE